MSTTIQISDEVKRFLDKLRLMNRESYNDVIEFLIEDNLELRKEIQDEVLAAVERVKSGKIISHEDAKKRLGL